jgi:hypothetical protein
MDGWMDEQTDRQFLKILTVVPDVVDHAYNPSTQEAEAGGV